MKKINIQGWQLLLTDEIKEEEASILFQDIMTTDYQVQDVLKETSRSSVKRISVNNQKMVLKIPHEKNNRLWIRLLTWFRKGEAFKNMNGMQILADHGIPTIKPILAAERRKFGMVVDSWLLYQYLEGKSCLNRVDTYPIVIQMLDKIHKENLLHGDPQIRNFITNEDGLFVIDANPKKATELSKAYEWAYLRKSAPEIDAYFGEIKESFYYKIARMWDSVDRWRARNKSRVKSLLH